MLELRTAWYGVAAGVVLTCHSPVFAQSDYIASPVQFPSSFSVNAMSQIGKVYSDPSALVSQVDQSPAPSLDAGLSFSPSAARRKANLSAIISKFRKVDPQGAAEMEKLVRSSDIIADIDRAMRSSFGLRANNVADAYTVWWMNAWQAAHGDLSDASQAKAQAVRTQAAHALASTPQLRGATDAAKQEFAEALLIQAALIGASAEAYAKDPAMMRKLGVAVRQGARASGLDLDSMMLTEEGFVPARKTGSAEPTGDERQAMAAGAKPDGPSYALLAAVGGAGLGAAFLVGKAMARRS